MRDEVVSAVTGAPRAVAAVGVATRVEIAATAEASAAPVVPAVIATAVVADLLAAVGDATGGATSERGAPRENDFTDECARWPGFGHEESTYSSDAVVLATELPMPEEDLAVDSQAFVAKETG